MIITIDGIGSRNADTLEKAARFFASQLLHAKTVKSLEIDIEVMKKLEVEGECVCEDETRNPRRFAINLRKQDMFEMIRTLGHEMVHVKQYAKNELAKKMNMARGSRGNRLASKWNGEFWYPKGKEDPYWDAPWEIEAYGREVGLHHKWVQECGKRK